jgi:predicted acyl esterase
MWRALDQKWYLSGRPYRDLGRLHDQPNPIFQRWLNHPSYDLYWRKSNPLPEQFARINIPVLTIAGYFSASEPGALYYFAEHYRYNPHADHTLLMGPYDDGVIQRNPAAVLQGYRVDPAALIDVRELQYQWFDHVFKGSATPPLLTDRINYEVMGANEWRHAASLAAMAGDSLRFYLDPTVSRDGRLQRRSSLYRPSTSRIAPTLDGCRPPN